MISVTDLRAGTTFELAGEPYIVLKYEHIKMGRGTANIKIKVRHLLTGSILEKSFISGAKVEPIATVRKKLQYLYHDQQNYCFMDPKDYEQYLLPADLISDQAPYLREQVVVDVIFWENRPLSIELPPKMAFTVAETGPGAKGNSATNIYKSATLDNGLKTKIPLFINQGETILVDTRSGEYAERVVKKKESKGKE